LALGAS